MSVSVAVASTFTGGWYRGNVARTPNESSRLGRALGGLGMPRALREEVPTALGEDPEGRVTDGGSIPPASIGNNGDSPKGDAHDRNTFSPAWR